MLPRVLLYLAFVSMLTYTPHAQDITSTVKTKEIGDEAEQRGPSEITVQQAIFRKSFSRRRREHLEAVKSLRKIQSYERVYKMIMVLGEKVIDVIESSKTVIENAGFSPQNNSFPKESIVQDALSTILENTALFGDIILHLPYVTHRILRAQKKWNATIHWSINFTNQTRHLLDKGTLTMIHLVGQELNITKREPGYFNPYWPPEVAQGKSEDTSKKKKSAKKEKRKRGPQMIKIEL